MAKYFLYAGDHTQAHQFAREAGLRLNDYVILHDCHQLLGKRKENIVIITIGTWYQREDSGEMIARIEHMKIPMIGERDVQVHRPRNTD